MSAQEGLKKELSTETAPLFVLYLDADSSQHGAFTQAMDRLGFKTLAAADIETASELLRQHPRDLVLTLAKNEEFKAASNEINPTIPLFTFAKLDELADLLEREALPRLQAIREEREMLQQFLSEAGELFDQAESVCLALEGNPGDKEALNQLFGIVHTIKGGSSFFVPKNCHRFAHRFEDLLKSAQQGKLKDVSDLPATFLRSIDVLKTLFEGFRTGEHPDVPESDLKAALALNAGGAKAPAVAKSDAPAPTSSSSKAGKANDIKVEITLLDEFMQMSGEMTVIRNMLNKCVRSVERQYAGDRDVTALVDLLAELHRVNGSVQSKVSELRKVAVRHVVKPLPRAVRDIARSLNKEIELRVIGDDLRIDTSLADVLSNSLLHLVKNSLDHGIELPADREKAGKPRQAVVSVESTLRDERVFVTIKDDGKGIDTKAVTAKAVSVGLRTPEQLARMPREEILSLIFESGLSTAKQVTDISGRGVGMSVVRDAVVAVGGVIRIESTEGKGTTFTLELPVPKSVLIKNCLFVGVGRESFALPEEDIKRVIQVAAESLETDISEINGARLIRIDDSLIPVVRLSDLLGTTSPKCIGAAANILILQPSGQPGGGTSRVALEVDSIYEVEDTVIKSMPPGVSPAGLYRGATFLSDGTVGLVLDPQGILEHAGVRETVAPARAAAQATAQKEASHPTIVFSLDRPGLYGLPRSDVFRIEDLNLSDALFDGGSAQIPYRGRVLTLIDVQKRLGLGERTSREGNTSVVVIQTEGRLFGLLVASVVDIAECAIMPAPDTAGAYCGYSELGGKTVSQVDLVKMLNVA